MRCPQRGKRHISHRTGVPFVGHNLARAETSFFGKCVLRGEKMLQHALLIVGQACPQFLLRGPGPTVTVAPTNHLSSDMYRLGVGFLPKVIQTRSEFCNNITNVQKFGDVTLGDLVRKYYRLVIKFAV